MNANQNVVSAGNAGATLAPQRPWTRSAAEAGERVVRRLSGRWLTLATGVGAAIPVIASTVRGIADQWMPFGDQAIIATRAYDVFSSHAPLVGQYSSSSHVAHHVTYSLGPLLYWLLAPAARLGPAATLPLTMGVVNAAAVVGTVALARRRGGVPFMLVTALALALMCRSLVAETYHDLWNPSAAVVPFVLVIFLCWSVACGEYRLLPLTALAVSFVAQCHLAYLLPSVGMLAAGLLGLGWTRRRASGRPVLRGRRFSWRRGRATTGRVRPWLAATVAVAAICWAAPLVDELEHDPGNITVVLRAGTAHQQTVGWGTGWHAVVRSLGVAPWWLKAPAGPWDRLTEVMQKPGSVATVTALVVLFAVVSLGVAGVWRRRLEVVAAAVIAAILAASIAADTAYTPSDHVLESTLGYTLWIASPAGVAVWAIVVWGVATLLPRRARSVPRPLRRAGAAAGIAAVAAVGGTVAAAERPDEHRSMYRPVAELTRQVERAIPRGRTIKLDGSPGLTTVLRGGVRYELRRHGVRALALHATSRLGAWYELLTHRYSYEVYIQDNDKFPVTRGTVVGRATWLDGSTPHTLTVRVWRT